MNAEQLLTHYARIAEAPDAITRLRRFVLDLAVRGKLLPQVPNEIPVDVGFHCLGTEGSVRIENLPANWRAARVGEALDFQYGKGLPAAKRLESGPVPVFGSNGIVGYTDEPLTKCCAIIVGRKGSAGALNLCAGPSWTTDVAYFIEVPEYLTIHFLLICLQTLGLETLSRGVKPGLSRAEAYRLALVLPPLAEQHRIVAKVDELMALCDRLEKARKEREAARDRMTAASLARLNAPDPDPATFTTHARFALNNLTKLSSQRRQIAHWRATIIELATRGKLSLEDSNDTPPAKALEAINDARDALVHAKLLRREKPLTAVRTEETPFQAPVSWLWTRLGEVALLTQYGTSLKAEQSTTGVPVLTMGNIQSGAVVSAKEKRIPFQSSELPELYLKKFDLLYNRTNSPELVGKTGIYLGDDDCVTFASYLIRLRFVAGHTDPHFINLAMNAPGFRNSQISPYIKQQTGQANVNGTAMKNMLIALPPIEEQRRIVAKVDELMALCGRLETCLATGDETRQRLLEAILHEALERAEERELELA